MRITPNKCDEQDIVIISYRDDNEKFVTANINHEAQENKIRVDESLS